MMKILKTTNVEVFVFIFVISSCGFIETPIYQRVTYQYYDRIFAIEFPSPPAKNGSIILFKGNKTFTLVKDGKPIFNINYGVIIKKNKILIIDLLSTTNPILSDVDLILIKDFYDRNGDMFLNTSLKIKDVISNGVSIKILPSQHNKYILQFFYEYQKTRIEIKNGIILSSNAYIALLNSKLETNYYNLYQHKDKIFIKHTNILDYFTPTAIVHADGIFIFNKDISSLLIPFHLSIKSLIP